MKKIFYIMVLITILSLIGKVNALCCEDPGTKQCKCWASGYCCYVSDNTACATSCDGSCYWSSTPCAGPAAPDLVIEDLFCTDHILYSIKNQGNAAAGASHSYLYVDGVYKASDDVGSLAAGASSVTEQFVSYTWICSGASDTIKVCADGDNAVSESNENNNCKEKICTCVPFDFSVSVFPSSGSTTQGGSVTTTTTATLTSGSSQSVSFSCSNLPSGTSCSFNPTSCNPTCSSTLTISTASTTPTGTYSITVIGTGGGLTRTTTYSLTVATLPPTCGNNVVETGEQCDPPSANSNQCPQSTSYCDYTNRKYCTRDSFGSCSSDCQCSYDAWSCGSADDSNYCSNCAHCGDGVCNCGENYLSCQGDCPATCHENGICELVYGEDQGNCPNDCYTVAYFTPSQNLLPGQEVSVIIYFNDSRWSSSRDASLNLTIDWKEWTECQVQNKKWTAMGWNHQDYWYNSTNNITITSMLGYAKLETNCSLPTWLTSGTHYFRARPTIYSEPTELTEAVAVFYVGTTAKKQENSLIEFIKHLLLLNIF
jgi:hypothetical protein